MEIPNIFTSAFSLRLFLLLWASSSSRSQFAHYDEELRPISMKLSDESCIFPSRWGGDWFQSGVASTISINHTWMSSKGRCVEADGDKFIVYSQSEECYRCVVFHEKHLNVLQYKETFCYPDPSALSLRSLCRRIPGDAHLYSMFRLGSDPIPCPFLGSFTFTYSRGQGVCHSPVSTIDTCSSKSQLVLNYQACYDVPGTESRVEELECLAQWKEGSSRYMVGLLKYHHDPSSYEERFRCFAYEQIGGNKGSGGGGAFAESYTLRRTSNFSSSSSSPGSTGSRLLEDADKVIFRVAQSGDATCLGLTPTEGSRTLALRKDVPVQEPCQFPNWLQAHVQWLNLDRSLSYAFYDSTLRITNISQDQSDNSETPDDGVLMTSAICAKEVQENQMGQEGVPSSFILRSTTGCQIGYACLRVYKRDRHIVELQMGKLGRDLESACHSSNFNEIQSPFLTLTSPTPEMRECPYIGHFDITDMTGMAARRCRQEFKGSFLMGCSGLDSIHVNMFCPNSEKVHEEYRCNGWWEDASGETFVIITSDTDKGRYCFQIQETTLELSPQELKRRQMKVADYDDDEETKERRSHKMFNFAKYTTTCHRKFNGGRGLLNQVSLSTAFNTTNFSECNAESGAENLSPHITFPVITTISFLFGFWRLVF